MDAELVNIFKGNHKYEVSVEELATEITQCLQIENLNFLIGAGCSSFRDDTGTEQAIPTMAGLAKEFYKSNPSLKVDRKNTAKDLFPNNLEALINHLISLKNITTSESSRKALSGKISIINKFIFERVCNTPYSRELIQLVETLTSWKNGILIDVNDKVSIIVHSEKRVTHPCPFLTLNAGVPIQIE